MIIIIEDTGKKWRSFWIIEDTHNDNSTFGITIYRSSRKRLLKTKGRKETFRSKYLSFIINQDNLVS